MEKRKERIVFWTAAIITSIALFFLFKYIWTKRTQPKAEYSIQTSIGIKTEGNYLTDSVVDIEKLLNQNNEIGFDVEILNENSRDIRYEVMVLINNKQESFSVDGTSMKVLSINLAEMSSAYKGICIDEALLCNEWNDLVVVIRQDCDSHVSENGLISELNPVIKRCFVRNGGTGAEDNIYEAVGDPTEQYLEDVDSVNLILLNQEDEYSHSLEVVANETIAMKVNFDGFSDIDKYYVTCIIDAEQKPVNGEDFLLFERGSSDIIKIEAPQTEGLYELEMLAIPYVENGYETNPKYSEVVTSARYTIQVNK